MSAVPDMSLSPADELFLLREEMTALRAREAELRNGFLTGALSVRGNWADVRIRRSVQRCFQRDRLPEEISGDGRYWRDIPRDVVLVAPRGGRRPPAAGPTPSNDGRRQSGTEEDEFDVIEPF